MSTEDPFFTDHQISYDITISTIQRLFNDQIKHCREEIDTNLADHLELFRDEFMSLFQHVYKDEEYKTHHPK